MQQLSLFGDNFYVNDLEKIKNKMKNKGFNWKIEKKNEKFNLSVTKNKKTICNISVTPSPAVNASEQVINGIAYAKLLRKFDKEYLTIMELEKEMNNVDIKIKRVLEYAKNLDKFDTLTELYSKYRLSGNYLTTMVKMNVIIKENDYYKFNNNVEINYNLIQDIIDSKREYLQTRNVKKVFFIKKEKNSTTKWYNKLMFWKW
jgi:hypothetical protein